MTTRWSLLCSTGAFTRDPDHTGYQAIMQVAPLLDIDGLEVLFYSDWYGASSAIGAALAASGLRFPVLHTEKSIGPLLGSEQRADQILGLARFTQNCQFAHAIGSHTVVLHLWGLPESDDYIERNLSNLADCLATADKYRVTLAVETIPCRRADPLTHVRRAIEHDPRCHVALDTEFLAIHNQLETALQADWLWHTSTVRHIHIKDFDGTMFNAHGNRRYLHPGEGNISFSDVFATLHKRAFAGSISLEASALAPDGSLDTVRIQQALAQLRAYAQE